MQYWTTLTAKGKTNETNENEEGRKAAFENMDILYSVE